MSLSLHNADRAVRRHYRLHISLAALKSNRTQSELRTDASYHALSTELHSFAARLETTGAD
jgi:hypothetical protein